MNKRLLLGLNIFAAILIAFGFIAFGKAIFLEFDYIWEGDEFGEKFGWFGDYMGGAVASFWSLAGVILFYTNLLYQKEELKIQRQELVENRIEFTINRLTNIIYHQLTRFENSLSNFRLRDKDGNESEESGLIAIISVNYLLQDIHVLNKELIKENSEDSRVKETLKLFDEIYPNLDALNLFQSSSRSAFSDIDQIIRTGVLEIKGTSEFNRDLDQSQKNLFNIFKSNITKECKDFFRNAHTLGQNLILLEQEEMIHLTKEDIVKVYGFERLSERIVNILKL